ncbi:MAG TPA: dihydroneopterin aldolase [Candidatus Saccharimonadales bacterium]|jgi:FolB domain-containing protein|nr:dihydroneopterin aldolase [Candidatus Saccharimonadales bacterium]
MDRIVIKDLEVFYRVGVSEEERSAAQKLLLTIELDHSFDAAAKKDDLGATIDYYAVAQRLLGLGVGREWKLIESVAVEVAGTVLREFGAAAIAVEVKKFVLPQAAYVSVRVARHR